MKMTAAIYNKAQLEAVINNIDAAILMMPHYAYVYENLDIDEAIKYCKEHNVEPIIALQRVVMENELDEVALLINKYGGYKFIVSDLGVVQLFKDRNRIKDVIYDPTTLVCNSLDLGLYASLGFDAVGMSNEIPLIDVITGYKFTKAKMIYQVWGRKMMYYSKRRLLSTYEKYRDISFKKDCLVLKEEKRDYEIPVYENENGTYCYRPYNISLLKEMDNLSFLEYAYFESLNMSIEDYSKIISIYRSVANKEMDIETATKELEALNLPIEDGFAYSDTVHVKEKIVQCER